MKNSSVNYRRNLPHIQPLDGKFFITYRLYASLPKHIISKYNDEYDRLLMQGATAKDLANMYLYIMDTFLDNQAKLHYLRDERLAKEVMNSLHFYDNKYFELICYTVMSNHVHVVVDCEGFEDINLSVLMGRIKGYSAFKCNKIRNTVGEKFWTQESYDHLILNDKELDFYIKYVINNPVAANIVDKWTDYKYTFIKEKYNENYLL